MALDGRLLARARERLAARREANIAERDRREAEAYAAAPELRDIDADLRALVGRVVDLAGRGTPDTEGLEQIRQESLELCAKKAETLTAHGFPPDYLDDIVDCPRCGDTGYAKDGSICFCLQKLYEEEVAKDLSAGMKAGEEGFADFRLDYYQGEARECMEKTLKLARLRRGI